MIVKATREDIEQVCRNLRADDLREVMATRWTDSIDDLICSFCATPGGKFAVIHDDRAVCIFGVSAALPGVGQGWLVGTDEIGLCGVEIAHACKKVISTLFENGVHRIQAFSADFHTQAHEWLELIGFKKESTMKSFGKNGEDYYCFAVCKQFS